MTFCGHKLRTLSVRVRIGGRDRADLRLFGHRLSQQAKHTAQVIFDDVLGGVANRRSLWLEGHGDTNRAKDADIVFAVAHGENPFRSKVEFLEQMPQHVQLAPAVLRTPFGMAHRRRQGQAAGGLFAAKFQDVAESL